MTAGIVHRWTASGPACGVRARALVTTRADEQVTCPGCRLELIRASIRAEAVSYGELIELQSLTAHIAPGDVELAEAAGIPEEDFR